MAETEKSRRTKPPATEDQAPGLLADEADGKPPEEMGVPQPQRDDEVRLYVERIPGTTSDKHRFIERVYEVGPYDKPNRGSKPAPEGARPHGWRPVREDEE